MDSTSSNPLDLIIRGITALLAAQREELRTEFRTEFDRVMARLPKWVTDEQAQQITGLSRDTLRRARQASGSVIIYKQDHGLRYDYDSLLKYNESRALGRGRLGGLLRGE